MKINTLRGAVLGSLLFAQSAAHAQGTVDDAQPPPTVVESALPAVLNGSINPASIPAGTVVEIQIDSPVNSKTFVTGAWYDISLTQAVMLGDQIAIPAGTKGKGQVVHAAKAGWGGKPGELILAARYLELGEQKIALRGMKMGGVGKNNNAEALLAGAVLTPLVFAINGTNANVGQGTLATAKLVADFPPAPPAPVAESSPPAEPVQPSLQTPPVTP